VAEVFKTRIAPAILAFVLALGVISAVAVTLSLTTTQCVQVFLRDNHWINGSTENGASNQRIMGDPINSPIPNKR